MRKLGIVGFSVLATLFIGCGKSDGPSQGVSEQTAAQQCFTDENFRLLNANGICAGVGSVNNTPQECYTNANYRAQNANGICASVPNNLPSECYTDTNYRINNMDICSDNSVVNNGTGFSSPFGTNNGSYGSGSFGNGTLYTGTNGIPTSSCGIQGTCQGTTIAHHIPTNCGSCGSDETFVVDFITQSGRCEPLPRKQSSHFAYAAVNYNKVSGLGSSTQLQFGYQGTWFFPGKKSRRRRAANSCNGDGGLIACNTHDGNQLCSHYLEDNSAVCVPSSVGSTRGYCGVIDAQGW